MNKFKKYKTIIIKNRLDTVLEDVKYINENLDEKGNVFYIMNTSYDAQNNVEIDCFDILNVFIENGYFYQNIMVYPMKEYKDVAFKDNITYIIWMCRSKKNENFNKDPIREKHIWKDVEWGKRAKNYSPKGKDPGNVWIPTEDDGKGKITKHILLNEEQIIDRLLQMTNSIENFKIMQLEEDDILESNKDYLETEIREEKTTYKKTPNDKKIIYFGSSEDMSVIEDNSIKQAITSPPYWDLKDYFKKGQIGKESYDVYLKRLYKVFAEVYKKLESSGTFWININTRRKQGKVTLNPKDIVKLCEKIGYYYKGIIIWHKSSGIPVGNFNIVDRYEYVFIFSKSINYKIENSVMSSFDDYKENDINGKAIWNINRKAGSVGKGYEHPAIFPTELVRRIILCGSNSNDTILDPFLGSGTSLIASLENKRNFIGFEYNEGFKELIEHRLISEKLLEFKVEYKKS